VQQEPQRNFELWGVPHRPWAFFPRATVPTGRPDDALRTVLALVARERDETVVVETSEPAPTAEGRVLRAERGTSTVRVEAEADGPALLVVQDAFWPGWRASVDGRPTEILAADYLVRAVRFPPGRHTLEMTYDPPELRLGLALSAVGALLSLLLAAYALRRAPAASR